MCISARFLLGALVLGVFPSCGSDDPPPLPVPDFPQVVDYGGPTLGTPHVVPIFFAGDPQRAALEDFLGRLGSSDYWRQTTAEYGVGPLMLDATVVVDDPPTGDLMDADVTAFFRSHLDPPAPGWPAPDDQKIYLAFFPAGVKIGDSLGTSCADFLGFHEEVALTGARVTVAVIPRCGDLDGQPELDVLTSAVAHELIEASTDPLPETDDAFRTTDIDHYVWTLATFGELSDMCDFQLPTDRIVGPYLVPRSWSNQAALAGHDPCLPAPSTPYFVAVPSLDENVIYSFGDNGRLPIKGVRVPLNQSRTIDVRLYADGARAAWDVDATDMVANGNSLTFKWDRTRGSAGDVLHVTITRVTNAANGGNQVLFSSQDQTTTNPWFGFIAN